MTDIRVASFNASLNRSAEGGLIADLSTPDHAQAQAVAEIIQLTDADVILINEFDFDAAGKAADLFQQNYLSVSQNGQAPIDYGFVYVADSNTGLLSGFDLNNDGVTATDADLGTFAYANDSQGFGQFPGQFSFVIYSKYEIDTANIRTFQEFLWKDMPGNLLTADPSTTDNLADFYTPDEIDALRLSSKNHVDVPVIVDGEVVHILAAHPTPPVFDGPEDRNGKRNHDEIRFWSDYVDGANYIYDDNGVSGGLADGERFVIVGDYNADPFDGDSFDGAINQLLDNPEILGSATDAVITPSSGGGTAAAAAQTGANDTHLGDPAFDTADFGFAGPGNPDNAPGNLRVDYALPSVDGLAYLGGEIFWQAPGVDPFPLAEFPTSDHRLVSVDLRVTNQNRTTVEGVEFLGMTEIASGTEFDGTVFGGISGIALDPMTGDYVGISDDFGTTSPNRFYTLEIDLSDGMLDDGDVSITDVTEVDPNGFLPGFGTADTEGVAIGQGGQLYISTERNNDGRFPQILLVSDDGVVTDELPVDDKFNGTDDTTGVINNLGFESLTISPDQTTLWVAAEGGLTQDGGRATLDNPGYPRIIRYDLESGLPVAEYLYEVDPIAAAPDPEGAFADSGLVELLALDNQGTLLSLERSFSVGAEDRGYTGKLYLVRTQGATDVSGEDSIPFVEDDGVMEPNVDEIAQKELLVDLADFGIVVDNIEGLSLGPVLEDGRQSLIIASDDNFSAFGPQANQFIALALDLGEVPTITPILETPDELRFDDSTDLTEGADSDDSAVWVDKRGDDHRVVTAMKEGGLRVYDLEGNELDRIEPEGIRYNNVDVIYGAGRRDKTDLVIASDRANDTLAIYKINGKGKLKDVTSKKIPDTIFGVDDGEATAYGLAAYTSLVDGKDYVFVTQADGASIAQLEIKQKGGKYTFETVRILDLPVPDGADATDFQSEGIVIDRETGIGYVAVEEELGLLSFEAELGGSNEFTTISPIDSDAFEPDLEGVSIHYGEDGEGLILVSSQGDSTYAAFDRITYEYKGSFAIREDGDLDGVQETDGIEIVSTGLPGFENGLFVTQDGSNEAQVVFADAEEGEIQNYNTNFKFSDLGDVLDVFDIDANPDFDPRRIDAQTLPQGVAAGDVTEDSAVLWARSLVAGTVTFEVFEENDTDHKHDSWWWWWHKHDARPVAKVTVEITDTDVPVKVQIDGLDDGTDYTYRVTDAAGATADGAFTTAEDSGHNGITFGITGDWRGELAPYPAIANIPDADLAFLLMGGDNIYADFGSPALPQQQAIETDDFRIKYQEVYGTRGGVNFWEEVRQSTAVFATIDDHEVTNDFAGGGMIGTTAEDEFRDLFPGDDPTALVNDSTLYENGLQAFQEYHPIADEFYDDTGDDRTAGERKLYRSQEYGQDAAIMILDQRSFRDEQIDGVLDVTNVADVVRFQTESLDPTRTLLGEAQLNDLLADLQAADDNGVTWKFIYSPEPFQNLGLNNADSWEGYQGERNKILRYIDDNDIDNVVFVAADIHATFVNNITYSETPLGPQIATSAFEITTGSVAFDAPFGPSVIGAISGTPLLPPEQEAFYNSLPIAPDGDGILNDKDDFIANAFNSITLDPLGLDRLGLDDNLPQADGLIDATLLQGGWVSAHTYGWTEFDIDADTQALTVTTYGIDFYTEEEVLTDPSSIAGLEPRIVSQFVVNPDLDKPQANVIEATQVRERHEGTDAVDIFVFEPGDSTPFRHDRIKDFEAGDQIDLTAFDFDEVVNRFWQADRDDLVVAGRDGKVILAGGWGHDRFSLVVDGDREDVLNGLILDFD